jgi:hypothetical protein
MTNASDFIGQNISYARKDTMNSVRSMTRFVMAALIAIPVSATSAQESEDCAVYAAAMLKLAPDTTKVLVMYDSISLATPQFAFHAWTGMGETKADTGFIVTEALWNAMRAEHKDRIALPSCVQAVRKVQRLAYDSIRAPFKDRDAGWTAFRAAHPSADGFYIFSRVHHPASDPNHALLYVAHASDWLSGGGEILVLTRDKGQWRVTGRRPMWAS